MDKEAKIRIYPATVESNHSGSDRLLKLSNEHDFQENETVIIMSEKDFNHMQKQMEHHRKMISSFEVMLEELKDDQKVKISHQNKIIHHLDNKCSKFLNELTDTQERLEEIYGLYDSLNSKYDELTSKNFNIDQQLKTKLEETKQILQSIYSVKNRHPINYIKEHIHPQNIPQKSSGEDPSVNSNYGLKKIKKLPQPENWG